MTAKRTILIGLGGASSSGKTTIAKILHSIAEDSLLLHQDDFYKADHEIPKDKATGFENWDSPDAINFDAFVTELKYIQQHGDFSPASKAFENRYNSDTKDQSLDIVPLETIQEIRFKLNTLMSSKNVRVAFIDGFLLHHDPEIIKLFDMNILLLASYETLRSRRLKRNGYQTQESFWVDPPGFFDQIVYPSYAQSHKYLFTNGDVEKALNPEIVAELNIVSFKNDEGMELSDVLSKCALEVTSFLAELNVSR